MDKDQVAFEPTSLISSCLGPPLSQSRKNGRDYRQHRGKFRNMQAEGVFGASELRWGAKAI